MSIVIVGAGLAGGTAATELREKGYTGPVVLVGDEQHPPYERPPLSKSYLAGKDPFEKALVHDAGWYAEHDVDLRLGVTATGLDVERQVLQTDAGELTFERLLLATGAEPRRLRVAEEAGVEVAYLRTVEDSDRLKSAFGDGRSVVVVGGGWIGLEVAAAAREAGCTVTLYEQAELPLLAVLGPTVAESFAALHREHGVDLRLGASVPADELRAADLVVAGIGVTPRVSLAESAGLAVDDGVLVDAGLRTSAPSVFAIGDIANHDHPLLGRIRVEHWDTAIKQGRVAAHNLAGGDETYDVLPYFFTDQYDLGMEYVGRGGPDDEVVVRGDLGGSRVFRAFWVRDGRVVAAMHANDWDATDALKEAVRTGELPPK